MMMRFALVALATMSIDQATKAIALFSLVRATPVSIVPWLNLTLGFNEGASFGMLSGVMSGRPIAMVGLTAVLTFGLAIIGLRATHPMERTGFAMIVGGSLGNIIDRLRQGAVTDFLDLFWKDWHWPTFNVADIAISVGAGLILLSALPRLKERTDRA